MPEAATAIQEEYVAEPSAYIIRPVIEPSTATATLYPTKLDGQCFGQYG
jgi:hypothetical protein